MPTKIPSSTTPLTPPLAPVPGGSTPIGGGGTPSGVTGTVTTGAGAAALVDSIVAPTGAAAAAALAGPGAVAKPSTLATVGETFPVDALSKIEGKGVSGQTFMLDGGSLRGLKLQVRRVKDGEQPGFEIIFQLTEDKLKGALERLETKGSTPGSVTFRGVEVGEDGIAKYTASTGTIGTGSSHSPPDLDSSATTWSRSVEDTKGGRIDMVHDKAALAIRGLTRIHLRGDDKKCTEQLQSLLKNLGLTQLFAPPTPKSKQINMMMRALWQADHKAASELSKGDLDKLKVSDLETALASAGFTPERIAGLHYQEVFPGHFTVVDPAQMEAMVEAGARYCYSTVTDPAHVHSILLGGQKSSVQRYKDGLIINGMSTNADFVTGGATGVFTRLVTQNSIYSENSWAGRTYKLLQNHSQLARTDWYGWDGDFYGRRWNLDSPVNFGVELVKRIDAGGGYKTTNELIFTAGNRPENIDRVIATTEADRQKLITHLKEKSYTPHNGLSLEEFVVLSPKLILMGPSPFAAKLGDLAAFVAEALTKSTAGDNAQLQWLLYEGPKGPERAQLEEKLLLEGPAAAQNLLLKALKLSGSFGMDGKQVEAVLNKLAALTLPEGAAILERLPSEAAEAMFRSGSDKAAELLTAKKPATTSGYSYSQPYGLSDEAFVRIYQDLAAKQKPGEPRSKALDLALDVRAEHLLNNSHAGFKAFLEKYPMVTPADPKAWVGEKVAALKAGGTGKAELAMYLAQLTDKAQIGAVQKQLIDADVPATLELLKTTLTTHKRLFVRGDVVAKALTALPTSSSTRQHLLGSAPAALLKTSHADVLALLKEHFKSSYQKDFGIYGEEWWNVVEAQLERTKGELTPVVRESIEIGGATLLQQPKYKEKLPQLAGLYEVADPAAFAAQALTEIAAPGPGVAKLGWMILGPKAGELRAAALGELLKSNDYAANSILNSLKSTDGKFPAPAAELRTLVAQLADTSNPANAAGLTKLLSTAGKDVLLNADGPTLDKLKTHLASTSDPLSSMGIHSSAVSALLQELDGKPGDTKLVRDFVLAQGSTALLTSGDATFIQYLTAHDHLSYAGLGKDPAWAAQTIKTACDAQQYYWTSSYYSSYPQYSKLPDGAAYLLKPDGKYDEKVLEAMESSIKSWGWSQPMFDKLLAVMADLPEAWKTKLTTAYKGA